MLSIGDIKKYAFIPQKGGKYYECVEVDQFFDQVKETLDALKNYYEEAKKDAESLNAKLKEYEDAIEKYKEDEENVRNALLIAQRAASTTINEAKAAAEQIVADAKAEAEKAASEIKSGADAYCNTNKKAADEMLAKAKADSKEALETADKESAAIVEAAKSKADTLLHKAEIEAEVISRNTQKTISDATEKLDAIKSYTAKFKKQVIDIMNSEISLLESIEVDDTIETEVTDEVYHPELTSGEYNSLETSETVETAEEGVVTEDVEEVVIEESKAADPVKNEAADEESDETGSEIVEEIVEEIGEIDIDEEIQLKKDDAEAEATGEADAVYNDAAEVIERDYYEDLMETMKTEREKPGRSIFTPIDESLYKEKEDINVDSGRENHDLTDLKFGPGYDIMNDDEDEGKVRFFSKSKK